MKTTKKCVFVLLFIAAFLSLSWNLSRAEYPERQITLITDGAPGGGEDLSCRLLADRVGKILGQPVVVDNRQGSSGALAVSLIASAKPDGYTIGQTNSGALTQLSQMADVTFDPFNSFDFILGYGRLSFGFITRVESPFKTFKDLIDYARANPGKTSIGVYGVATAHNLAATSVAKSAGIKWELVPFKGSVPGLTAVLGGHVDAGTQIADVAMPQIVGGRVRLLAAISKERWKWAPEVPTLRELGYDVWMDSYMGLSAPKGVPKPALDKLVNAFKQAMAEPEFIKTMDSFYLKPYYQNPVEYRKSIEEMYKAFGDFARSLGLHRSQQKK